MERRKAIKNIGLSFGAVVATPSVLSLFQSCNGPVQEPWVPEFFTGEEGKVLRRVVDTMLPASGSYPGATEVNVHVFMDKYIKDVLEFEDRKASRDAFAIMMKNLLSSAGVESVDDLEEEHYVAFLDANLRKTKEEEEAIFQQMGQYMEANNGDATGLPDDVRIYSLLTQMRQLAIWAYKTNQQVGENILAYKPIPGEQKGCVDLQETTGGMAWSL